MSRFSIVKVDRLQGIIYGWGNIVTEGEQLVTDHQGDQWPPDELHDTVIDFMENSRQAGIMHEGKSVGVVVASFVTTPELVSAFFSDTLGDGVTLIPVGWMLGVKIDDKSIVQDVLDGKLAAFSIQGSGDRSPVDA